MSDIRRLMKEISRYRGRFSIIILVTIIGTGLSLVVPWIYRGVVNLITESAGNGIDPETWQRFWQFIVAFIIIGIAERGFEILKWWMNNLWWMRLVVDFTNRSTAHLSRLPVQYFDDHPVGFIGERMTRGVTELANIATVVVIDFLPTALRFLGVLAIMMIFDYKLGLVFLVGAPLFVYLTFVRAGLIRRSQDKIRNQFEKMSRIIYQMIGSIRLFKLFTQEKNEDRKVARVGTKLYALRGMQERHMHGLGMVRDSIMQLSYVAVLGYGGYLVLTNVYTVGDLVLFITYVQMTFFPLYRLTHMYDAYVRSMRAAKRLFAIWDQTTEVDRETPKELEVREGAISFEDVVFDYQTKRLVGQTAALKGLNLKIEPQKVVALIGPSGVGKSTVIKLLTRFIDPSRGRITIDGQDISKVSYESLRRNISVVLQDEQTFSDTMRHNIQIGKPSASTQEIMRAAKVANIDKFINRLPKKLNTYLGERGVKLSGGERQRVAIARAVLKDAPILVLDEATSALDSENEKLIQEALDNLISGKTAIIIAHRLSTIKRADKIVVLEGGKISEQGTHQELMAKSGYYRRLFTMQGQALEG